MSDSPLTDLDLRRTLPVGFDDRHGPHQSCSVGGSTGEDSNESDPWVRMTILSGSEELEMMSHTMASVTNTALVTCMKLGQTILES
jgi:hypothetical protein